jgi:SAM-dependent methyltransferase
MTQRRRTLKGDWPLLNWAVRYVPVVAILRAARAESVLDVGCGPGALGVFYPGRRFVGCDVAFVARPPWMTPVVAKGGTLPFRDGAFDIVISLDTLEHVPAGERARFVADLARVGRRYLVMAAPCGRLAALAERALDGWYALLGISTPPWLAEHFQEGLPERSEIEATVAALGRPYRVYGNENLLVHLLIMMAESLDRLRPRLSRLVRERMTTLPGVMARLNLRPTYRLIFVIDLGRSRGESSAPRA